MQAERTGSMNRAIVNRAIVAACMTAVLLGGCALGGSGAGADASRPRPAVRSDMLSEQGNRLTVEELDQMTNGYADRYLTYVASAIEKIIQGNPSTEQVRRAQLVRVTQVSAIYDIVTNADPFTQLLDLVLVVTLQSQKWIDEDHAEQWFGPRAQFLIEASRRAREDVWRMAARVMKPEQLEQLDYMIWDWRQRNRGVDVVSYVRFDEFAAERGKSMVADVMGGGGLLAPVGEAKKAVDEVRLLAERAFYLTKRMPLLLNWQVESTVANVIDQPQLKAVTDSMSSVTRSVDRVASLAERMPEEISRQHREVFAQLERSHPLINAALVQYRGAITDTDRLAGSVKQVNATADVLLKTLQDTSAALNTTMTTIDKVFLQPGKDKPADPNARPFDIESYAQAAAAFTGTLREANDLLGKAGGLLGASNDAKWIHQRMDEAAGLSARVIDSVFWRAVVLVAWFFALLLLYRVLAHRFAPRVARSEAARESPPMSRPR